MAMRSVNVDVVGSRLSSTVQRLLHGSDNFAVLDCAKLCGGGAPGFAELRKRHQFLPLT